MHLPIAQSSGFSRRSHYTIIQLYICFQFFPRCWVDFDVNVAKHNREKKNYEFLLLNTRVFYIHETSLKPNPNSRNLSDKKNTKPRKKQSWSTDSVSPDILPNVVQYQKAIINIIKVRNSGKNKTLCGPLSVNVLFVLYVSNMLSPSLIVVRSLVHWQKRKLNFSHI